MSALGKWIQAERAPSVMAKVVLILEGRDFAMKKMNNKLYLNTVATELMCFYKYSKNVFIHIYIYIYDMIIKNLKVKNYYSLSALGTKDCWCLTVRDKGTWLHLLRLRL